MPTPFVPFHGYTRTKKPQPFPRRLFRSLLGLGFLGSFASTAHADDLTGKWQASSLRVSWSVGDWGADCGPKPSGGGESGGTVTLTQQGSGFSLSGLGRSYSSAQCWEQMPGLTPRTRSVGSSAIQTMCTMPQNDPRKATVTTSWYPRGDEIYFDETGQYQFSIAGSKCTASVRRTRVLKRVVTTPSPPQAAFPVEQTAVSPETPETTNPPATSPPPPPEHAARCDKAGPATQLEVSPRLKLMRHGERFSFVATARDAIGCRVPVSTSWRLLSPSAGVRLQKDGTLIVDDTAAVGKLSVEAQVEGQKVVVYARIVSDAEFESLIAGGDFGVLGESLETSEITLTTNHVELDEVPVGPSATAKRSPLLWVLGALIALLGAAVALLLHRSRTGAQPVPQLTEEDAFDTPEPLSQPAASAAGHAAELAPPPPALEPAVLANAPSEPAATPRLASPPSSPDAVLRRLCPVCGRRYEEAVLFCPEDGARLMRVN